MQKEKFITGDINLACALMALGIPLDAMQPCSIIAHENGQMHSRYNFEAHSINGRFYALDMSKAWASIDKIPAQHPLAIISHFVRRAGRGRSLKEWLEHAIDEFNLKHVTNYSDAESHVASFPENPESYCLAFVCNRRTLLDLHYKATQKIYMSNGDRRVLIDSKLPAHQKKELVNRLNG